MATKRVDRSARSCELCGGARDEKPGPVMCSGCRNSCRMCSGPRTGRFRICHSCKPEYDRQERIRNAGAYSKRQAAKKRCMGCGSTGAFRGTCTGCRNLCRKCWSQPMEQMSYCLDCHRIKVKSSYRAKRGIPIDARPSSSCLECGDALTPSSIHATVAVTTKFCSDPCRYKNKTRGRRAKRLSVAFVKYSRAEIMIRDGWTCQICNKRIDKRLRFPNPMSASIDHIIPLSEGGTDEPKNVQAAHWRCNVAKGNRPANDQLRLVG
jgi:hypothetical protein